MDGGLTADRVRELLDYDPQTGVFTWRRDRINGFGKVQCRSGDVAGTARKGRNNYRVIVVDYRQYGAHRLAWLYTHGSFPECHIDHIDGDKANNSLSNLRLATTSQNSANRKRGSNNKSGFKGVSKWKDGKYHAEIIVRGKRHYLGGYKRAEDAHAACTDAAKRHNGEFARWE